MLRSSAAWLIVLLAGSSCSQELPQETAKVSVSVKLEECSCKVERVELSLIRDQPEGACIGWQGQSDGVESLNLAGLRVDPQESVRVALAAYCMESTTGTGLRASDQCCLDLSTCAGDNCRNPNSWCQQCAEAVSRCPQLENIDLQHLESLLPQLGELCMGQEGLIDDCCHELGACVQAAWIGCSADQCGACDEASQHCGVNQGFDPVAMEGSALLMFILESCNQGQNDCCVHAIECIQQSQSVCATDQSCPGCQAAGASCGESMAAGPPTPAAAEELIKQLCGGDEPARDTKECMACSAIEALKLAAGELELKAKASEDCHSAELSQLQELSVCATPIAAD